MSVPGIGLIIATALVGFLGDLRRFPSGRHLASYLGLTPREYSSGLRQRLGRISKCGAPRPNPIDSGPGVTEQVLRVTREHACCGTQGPSLGPGRY